MVHRVTCTALYASHTGRLGLQVTSDPYGAVAPPLYQTATFHQLSAVECGEYDYSRSGNPTRAQLEAQMAALEVRGGLASTLVVQHQLALPQHLLSS